MSHAAHPSHTHHAHADGTVWQASTSSALSRRGLRAGGARAAVVDALAAQDCCASAQEIHDRIRAHGGSAGIASVYRALELLHGMGMVTRVDTGDGIARFEPAHPDGAHHHHLVCTHCGAVEAFQDEPLEQAIHAVADRVDFQVISHDVALRGICRDCR